MDFIKARYHCSQGLWYIMVCSGSPIFQIELKMSSRPSWKAKEGREMCPDGWYNLNVVWGRLFPQRTHFPLNKLKSLAWEGAFWHLHCLTCLCSSSHWELWVSMTYHTLEIVLAYKKMASLLLSFEEDMPISIIWRSLGFCLVTFTVLVFLDSYVWGAETLCVLRPAKNNVGIYIEYWNSKGRNKKNVCCFSLLLEFTSHAKENISLLPIVCLHTHSAIGNYWLGI